MVTAGGSTGQGTSKTLLPDDPESDEEDELEVRLTTTHWMQVGEKHSENHLNPRGHDCKNKQLTRGMGEQAKSKRMTEGVCAQQEGEKGGGMFTALAGDEVDKAAIKETADLIRRGELSNAVQLDEDDEEDEKFRGQFRFLKLTGRKFANIAKKEVKQVRSVVATAITKAGGNPALLTATAMTFGGGKQPFVLIGNVDSEYIQTVFDLIQIKTASGTDWTVRVHNVGDLYWEARWAWKPANKQGNRMQMKATDVAGYFLKHPMTTHLVEEIVYTHDRIHPISNNHQKVRVHVFLQLTKDRASSQSTPRFQQTHQSNNTRYKNSRKVPKGHTKKAKKAGRMGNLKQVLFLKMKKGEDGEPLQKGGDGYLTGEGEPPEIMAFPTEIQVQVQGQERGKLFLSFFHGFEHCGSATHGEDKVARLNHICCMCYSERMLQAGAESRTPDSRGKGEKRERSTPGSVGMTKKKLNSSFNKAGY